MSTDLQSRGSTASAAGGRRPRRAHADRAAALVSVVIPVRNGGATLGRALESVARQGYEPIEVIVVDDGSTDDVNGVLHRFQHLPLKLRRFEKSRGAAAARNAGLAMCAGEFVAFLDADDEWLPGKIERQVQTLIDDAGLSFAYTAVLNSIAGEPGRRLVELVDAHAHGADAWKTLLKHGCVVTSSVLARRSAIEAAGGFDHALIVAEDQDLWIRLALLGHVHHDASTLVRKHCRQDSLSAVHRHRMASVTLPMVERHVERLASRLTRKERTGILSYRRLVAGRNSYESGQTLTGLGLILAATWRGGNAAQNLLYLASASPLARVVKRAASRSRRKQASAFDASRQPRERA